MVPEEIIKEIREANQNLVEMDLVKLTFGNVSGKIGDSLIGIKPSGIPFNEMKDEDIVLLNIDGQCANNNDLKPSVDSQIHIQLYASLPHVRAIVHTHSVHATAFAQAKAPLNCFGTTHADYFYGTIPVSRELTQEEVENDYEKNIGKSIVETFLKNNLDYLQIPACLVPGHGSFVWGSSVKEALDNAIALEEVARLALYSSQINPNIKAINNFLLDKHFLRKHGKNKYYGQTKK